MSTIEELQARMTAATANLNANPSMENLKEFEEAAKAIVASKAERAKAEAEAARKEAEALAGDREKLMQSIRKSVAPAIKKVFFNEDTKTDNTTPMLEAVKATGWTISYKLEGDILDVALAVPALKKTRASTGNGGAGKTKDEYGMSLAEVFEKYANPDERAKLTEAEAKDVVASEKLGKHTNSNAWRIKNEVKKRVIAEGLLAPAK